MHRIDSNLKPICTYSYAQEDLTGGNLGDLDTYFMALRWEIKLFRERKRNLDEDTCYRSGHEKRMGS